MADEKQQQATGVDPQILKMWRKDGRLYGLVGVVIGLALGVIILPAIGSLENAADVQAFLNDLAPELIGILITVAFIDRLNRRRDERNAEEALKRQLIDDAASTSNEIAKNAVHQLRRKRWLEHGKDLLKGENLWHANLKDVDLRNVNLQQANLRKANLQEANLRRTNLLEANLDYAEMTEANLRYADMKRSSLRGAVLIEADLKECNLRDADLQMAYLWKANLTYANLRNTNLTNADLRGTDLSGANLREAVIETGLLQGTDFDETTILPDHTYWSSDTDMGEFTDPTHPNFKRVFDWNDE